MGQEINIACGSCTEDCFGSITGVKCKIFKMAVQKEREENGKVCKGIKGGNKGH